jgi:hypothetical protein
MVSGVMPLILCDARSRESAKQVLVTLVEYVMAVTRHGRAAVASARTFGQAQFPHDQQLT